jgi:hypothetical protein
MCVSLPYSMCKYTGNVAVNVQHKVCECWLKLSLEDRSPSGLSLATSPKDFLKESFKN